MSMPDDIRAFNRSVVEEYRATGGRITQGRLKGANLVLLTTVGARTGRPHTTPLGRFLEGPGYVVLWASAAAAPSHPDWYRNLTAEPRVTVELVDGGELRRREGTARTARGAERERLLAELRAARPEIAAHQDRTEREIPLVVVEYG
jgi:deazaflavin-dependent oxidoreductase (nitroreductase family)